MEYHLEIYRPGSCASDGCIKTFTAASPFLPIRGGDLINTKTWEVEWPLLRVVGSRGVVRLGSPSALSTLTALARGYVHEASRSEERLDAAFRREGWMCLAGAFDFLGGRLLHLYGGKSSNTYKFAQIRSWTIT